MKLLFTLIVCVACFIPSVFSQKLPEGYILQYNQNFNNKKGLADFSFNNPSQWNLTLLKKNYYLQFNDIPKPDSEIVSLPPNRAILKNRIFGDFILEAEAMPVIREGSDPEVCLILGLKDSTKYYYILLSTDPANDMQGIYLVKKSIPTKLSRNLPVSAPLKNNTWQKIRIERNIVLRTIRVFVGNMDTALMEVKDYELVIGSIGFGSLRSPFCLDNVSIWAPTMIEEE